MKKLPQAEQEKTHRNVLVVLDDVVGAIKKAEFDPRLAQLVMNRRHIIFNGTISLIMVTQKYTLIPARIRSNANWLVLYQLNPMDLETAYRDAVTLPPYKWFSLLQFVYGVDMRSKPEKAGAKRVKKKQGEEEEEEKAVMQEDRDVQEMGEREQLKIGEILKKRKYENLGIWVEANMYFKNFKRINVE